MIIQHNLLSSYTSRQLKINNSSKAKSSERLSSGYRINRASDDAASLTISEKMRSQIRGLDQAADNIQNGLSAVQTADGALHEVHAVLHRMNELFVTAANDTYSDTDREQIESEYKGLRKEINRITQDTEIFFDNTLTVGNFPDDISIYKANDGSYAGIIYQDVRYSWDQIKTSDGNHSLADTEILSESYFLNTVGGQKLEFPMSKGDVLPSISKHYDLEANAAGITIDDVAHSWSEVKDEDGNTIDFNHLKNGLYSFEHFGSIIEFAADEDDDKEDIIKKLNKGNQEIKGWESKLDGFAQTKAVYNLTRLQTSVPINDANKSLDLKINADTSGIRINNNTTVPWSSLDFAPPFYNSANQGLDFDSGQGLGADTTVTFQCPDTGIGFQFQIQAEASIDAVIKGLNNITIPVSANAPVESTIALSSNPATKVFDNAAVSFTSINYTTQRDDFNLDFSGSTSVYANSMNDFKISCSGIDYEITPASSNNLLNFFKNGSAPSIGLTFYNSSKGSIGINFTKLDNQTDAARPAQSTPSTPAEQTALNTYVDNLVAQFKDQFSASSFSIRSQGASLNIDSFGVNTMGMGNTADVPSFGVKPEPETPWHIQAGTNSDDKIDLSFGKLSANKLNLNGIDLSNNNSSGQAISIVNKAIQTISNERSKLGAYQNRLEYALQLVDNVSENTQSAESKLRDTDMSKEMVQYSKSKILNDMANSVLSNANQNSKMILQLLQ
ncbi:MAG: flagellin FliC [Herbinix sp.]|jgi:flagellin-like hook-associated protein FlgL|nr:flagellin FliC [Herbinix sp.]